MKGKALYAREKGKMLSSQCMHQFSKSPLYNREPSHRLFSNFSLSPELIPTGNSVY
jgi:hypothetical protein